jgi:glycosyltransferase involved in cell wall biosynthesis
MRVTHVITRLVVGGAQENTVASVLGLREKPGLEVQLVAGPQTGPEGSLQSRLDSHPELLTLVPELVRPVHPWKDLIAFRKLTRLFQAQRPHLVHTHSGKAGILGRLAAALARVPVIVHHIHGPSFGAFQSALANTVFRAAERRAAKVTTHFICSANAMTRVYLAAGIGTPEMFTRILSGFDLKPYTHLANDSVLRARLGIPEDAFVIGKLARLSPLKGHEDLFTAFQMLLPGCPHARLLLIGDGALRLRFERQLQTLGLADKVSFNAASSKLESARRHSPGEINREVIRSYPKNPASRELQFARTSKRFLRSQRDRPLHLSVTCFKLRLHPDRRSSGKCARLGCCIG